jgi:hypothetical protein
MTTAVIVQSGHNLASSDQLLSALTAHARTLRETVHERDSKVIELTEMAAAKFGRPLRMFSDMSGMHLFHPAARGPSECAILTSRPIHRQTYLLLTDKKLDPHVTNRSADIFVDAVQPEDDDWFAMLHTPAHNDGLTGRSRAKLVYLDMLVGLKTWRMRTHGKVAIGADWNADPQHNKHVAAILAERFPHLAWAGDEHQKPTEGGRVIDGVLTNRVVIKPAETLGALPGFDHRGVLVVLG